MLKRKTAYLYPCFLAFSNDVILSLFVVYELGTSIHIQVTQILVALFTKSKCSYNEKENINNVKDTKQLLIIINKNIVNELPKRVSELLRMMAPSVSVKVDSK